jgi:trimethylamine--corrinoid protein Co-methyltransferase
LGYEAIAEVQPGGHFFAAAHTMARYRTAFHGPMIADWSNFGTWTERGSLTATDRAHAKWKQVLAEFAAPPTATACSEALDELIAKRTAEGGAPPLT